MNETIIGKTEYKLFEYTDTNGAVIGSILLNRHNNSVVELKIHEPLVLGTSPENIEKIEMFLQLAKREKWIWKNAKNNWE